MAKTVSWTDAAWADLEAVADYIARDSRYYAAAFVREVREAARSLKRFPERGTIVAELADPTIRELYVRDYRLLYHVTGRQVSILGFIHGARDLAALWKKEGPFRTT